MSTITTDNLAYHLPKNTSAQLKKLSQITSIPSNLLINGGQQEVEAICYMILYRHLNHIQRRQAMIAMRSVQNKALVGELIKRTLDTTFVNPKWGVWSLSNDELLKEIKFHSTLDNIVSGVGFGASGLSIKELISKIMHQKSMNKANWVTIIIWGCIFYNKYQLHKVESEKDHRSTLNTSRYYK